MKIKAYLLTLITGKISLSIPVRGDSKSGKQRGNLLVDSTTATAFNNFQPDR